MPVSITTIQMVRSNFKLYPNYMLYVCYGCVSVKKLRSEEPVMDIEDLVMAGTKQR